jgi:hypothetical protein
MSHFSKFLNAKNRKPLLCPFCKKELRSGEMKRYETLVDHVSDPNMETHPPRPTLVCECEAAKGSFWDEWGDCYTKEYKPGWHLPAINSGSWASEKDIVRERKIKKIPVIGTLIKLTRSIRYKITMAKYWDV